jgi:hypothetical protein
MTVLQALAILEDAVLECKRRNVNTPEVTEALDFLEPHIRPTWLVNQYRHALDGHGDREYDREGQQQVLRPSFDGIRDSVRNLLGIRLDRLTRQFAATQDVKVKAEIERLTIEYDKLKEPWRFVVK